MVHQHGCSSESNEEALADKIISGLNELLGIPSAQAGVGLSGAAVSPDTAKIVAATFNALALKYGPRVAKFMITKAMPIVIPGVGAALLAKDLYDLGNATYEIMLQKGIISGSALGQINNNYGLGVAGGAGNINAYIDPETSKPRLIWTPIPEIIKPDTITTPGLTEEERRLFDIPGFPAPLEKLPALAGFPDMRDYLSKTHIFTLDRKDLRKIVGTWVENGAIGVPTGQDKASVIESEVTKFYKEIAKYQREGTMEICCLVVYFEVAKQVIEKDLLNTEFDDYVRIFQET